MITKRLEHHTRRARLANICIPPSELNQYLLGEFTAHTGEQRCTERRITRCEQPFRTRLMTEWICTLKARDVLRASSRIAELPRRDNRHAECIEIRTVIHERLLRELHRAASAAAREREPRELRPRRATILWRQGRKLEPVFRVCQLSQSAIRDAIVVVRGGVIGINGQRRERELSRRRVFSASHRKHRAICERGDIVGVLEQRAVEHRARLGVLALADPLLAARPESVRRVPVERGGCVERAREIVHALVHHVLEQIAAECDTHRVARGAVQGDRVGPEVEWCALYQSRSHTLSRSGHDQ